MTKLGDLSGTLSKPLLKHDSLSSLSKDPVGLENSYEKKWTKKLGCRFRCTHHMEARCSRCIPEMAMLAGVGTIGLTFHLMGDLVFDLHYALLICLRDTPFLFMSPSFVGDLLLHYVSTVSTLMFFDHCFC